MMINSLQKTKQPPSCIAKFLQLFSFDSGYSLVVLGSYFLSWGWGVGGREDHILQIVFPKHSFPFFYYHKINLHLGITISEHFFPCFLKYESFSNCQQSYYRNIGYFERIYTCENLTFHLQTEKDAKFVSEMVCLHNT